MLKYVFALCLTLLAVNHSQAGWIFGGCNEQPLFPRYCTPCPQYYFCEPLQYCYPKETKKDDEECEESGGSIFVDANCPPTGTNAGFSCFSGSGLNLTNLCYNGFGGGYGSGFGNHSGNGDFHKQIICYTPPPICNYPPPCYNPPPECNPPPCYPPPPGPPSNPVPAPGGLLLGLTAVPLIWGYRKLFRKV